MIPQRVKLKGFLCYKEEQEVCFDGASLWILAGVNGSGKSSIFDAVTYALFGHHRGGSQDAYELINKDSDRASVEFEFCLEGQCYQAYRTLQRTKQGKSKGTQQIYRKRPDGAREALDGTNLKSGFDTWVQENIGLSYDTFTSSVLLLQGKADKLLDSTAKGRHEVLAGIVDLERYKRLHQRADEERKSHESTVKSLQSRLTALPEVSAAALAEADERIAAASAARQQAQTEVERLQGLEFQARQWGDLQARLTTARQRWQHAQTLLAEAPAIERDTARLEEIRIVLPRLQAIFQQKTDVRESERKTLELTGHWQKLDGRLAEQKDVVDQTRDKRTALQNMIAADEQRQRDVAGRLRRAAALLDRLKEYERHEADLARWQAELARLPSDPADVLRQGREEYDSLASLTQAVPLLVRLQAVRADLGRACQAATQRAAAQDTIEGQGKQRAAEVARLKPQLEAAAHTRQQADEKATKALTLLEENRRQLEELTELQGAKVCRHCGQALTAAHLRDEKRRREKEVSQADKHYRQEAAAQQEARKAEQELRDQSGRLEKQLQEAREEFREHRQKAEQARQDVERLQRECGQTYHELAEPFRSRVSPAPPADWRDTSYPSADDLAALRRQADGLAAARQKLGEAERLQAQWTMLKSQEAGTQQQLLRLQGELPADRPAVRHEHVRLDADLQALERGLTAKRSELAATQETLDGLAREREQLRQDLAGLQGKLSTEEVRRQQCRQTLDRARKELPAAWQVHADRAGLSDLNGWDHERTTLIDRQTDERGRQLQQARLNLEVLRRDRDDLERQQEQFPEEARRAPAHFQSLVKEARETYRSRDDELVQTRQHKVQMENHRKQRAHLDEELLRADKEHAHAKLLADLLGRDRLQLHLVRQAERQVVDYANAVLDRLSGGQLFLKLCGEAEGDGSAAKALELEAHNRSTGEKAINVAFLSGSQKFRVAVSLALGIGQYASRRHRPIESVIIDEGFGCLDKEGRQAMIQEMQNLRDQLKCILLVSHQEEFANAFADGYHFEIKDKTTKATRFQR